MKVLPSAVAPKPTTFVFDVSTMDTSVRKVFEKQVSKPGGTLWSDQVGVDPNSGEKDVVFLSTNKKRHAKQIADNFDVNFFTTKEQMKDINLFVKYIEQGRNQVEFLKNAVVNLAKENHNHLANKQFYNRFTEFATQMYKLLGGDCAKKAG